MAHLCSGIGYAPNEARAGLFLRPDEIIRPLQADRNMPGQVSPDASLLPLFARRDDNRSNEQSIPLHSKGSGRAAFR
jgi:hypothetical protein